VQGVQPLQRITHAPPSKKFWTKLVRLGQNWFDLGKINRNLAKIKFGQNQNLAFSKAFDFLRLWV